MSTARFGILTVCLFALAFIGISWASKGFPGLAYRITELRPDSRQPAFKQVTDDEIRKEHSDENKQRDALSLALLQASMAYKISSCDPTIKQNLIAAVTNYTLAWSKIGAAQAFQAHPDGIALNAFHEAYKKGGIEVDDFPKSVHAYGYLFSSIPNSNQSACGDRKQGLDPWIENERSGAEGQEREVLRRSAIKAFSKPWSELCSLDGHRSLIAQLNDYYYQRNAYVSAYNSAYGEAARQFAIRNWQTTDDTHLQRLMSEAYEHGFFALDELADYASTSMSELVNNVKVTIKPCST